MRILIFINHYLPGTNSGGPVRSIANLVGHLSVQYDFYIVTQNTDYCSETPYSGILTNTWNQLPSGEKVYYISKGGYAAARLREILKEFDTVYINGIYSFRYSILPLWMAQRQKKRIIVAPRGMVNPQAFSTKSLKKKLFLQIANRLRLYKKVTFHATSQQEKAEIRKRISPDTEIIIAPNLSKKFQDTTPAPIKKTEGILKLVSLARIAPEKGTLHMFRILNQIKEGEIQLDIYGIVYNKPYWQRCLEEQHHLPRSIKVNYRGVANKKQADECLRKAHFLFMPSEGENFGHSILEALAAGRPVIISDQTPWRDLEKVQAGWNIPLDQPKLILQALRSALFMDQKEYDRWSHSAYKMALDYWHNPEIIAATNKLFNHNDTCS